MARPEYIQSRLEALTNAEESAYDAKNHRYHYYLLFIDTIGFDWLLTQVQKASQDAEMELELYEIMPVEWGGFRIEVREVDRRETNVDDDQHGLGDFEG